MTIKKKPARPSRRNTTAAKYKVVRVGPVFSSEETSVYIGQKGRVVVSVDLGTGEWELNFSNMKYRRYQTAPRAHEVAVEFCATGLVPALR